MNVCGIYFIVSLLFLYDDWYIYFLVG